MTALDEYKAALRACDEAREAQGIVDKGLRDAEVAAVEASADVARTRRDLDVARAALNAAIREENA